ncbi:MAG: MraY family glycosyltransferase [Microgenomates group bacterium]
MILSYLLALIIATLVAPVIISFYKKYNWVDTPEGHVKKTHTIAVPRGGGVVIFMAVLVSSIFLLTPDKYLVSILVGAGLLTIVGILDDIYDIHPLIRIGTGLIAALIVVGSGIGIAYVSNPFGPGVIHLDQPQISFFFAGEERSLWILADIFALIFIVWNMNIVNWSKGVDGQMPGFVSIAAVIIGILSTRFIDDPTQFNTALLSAIVAGAYAGLLLWNWYPQKIMPGYGAGSLAGYFLGVLAIISGAKLATILMVLGVPTADAIFTITRRILAGKSPLWGDRGHLHHKLLDVLHWNKKQVAIFYWLSSLTLGMLSLYLNTGQKMITIGLVTISVFTFLIWAKIKKSNTA